MLDKYVTKSNFKKTLLPLIVLLFLLSVSNLLFAQESQDPFASDNLSTESEFGEDESDTDLADAFAEEGMEESEENDGIEWTGFLEIEQGGHHGEDSVVDKKWIMSNGRFRLSTSSSNDLGSLFIKADIINDSVIKESYIDLREARIVVTPFEQVDLSLGKQVNTWGVSDMLFINDLFPKNWVSNFSGRDMESMKNSANSLRLTGYLGDLALDMVYHPEFAPDTTPTGCRFSVYDPNKQALVANQSSCELNHKYFDQPDKDSSETAIRLKLQIGSYELALYGYQGFFKNPKGLQWVDSSGDSTGNTDLVAGQMAGYTTLIAYYPKLEVQGASIEGQLGLGIVSMETGYYNSIEDEDGDNPLLENSKWKYLLGYRFDLSANLGLGIQWYQEHMLQYDEYEKAVQTYFPQNYEYRKKERQNTYTMRVTIKAQQETLWISIFHYERPEDKDRYTKLDITKRLNNNLETIFGANIFDGEENYQDREFGMLKDDDNMYARVKYNF